MGCRRGSGSTPAGWGFAACNRVNLGIDNPSPPSINARFFPNTVRRTSLRSLSCHTPVRAPAAAPQLEIPKMPVEATARNEVVVGPSSTMFPSSRTTILSALAMVLRRCAMTITVLPAQRVPTALWIEEELSEQLDPQGGREKKRSCKAWNIMYSYVMAYHGAIADPTAPLAERCIAACPRT